MNMISNFVKEHLWNSDIDFLLEELLSYIIEIYLILNLLIICL